MPPVIKNLLIINGIVFLAQMAFPVFDERIALYLFTSDLFNPFQIVTHMFAHANFFHIFLNMFALWMFGAALENVWGPKRFLTFYLICGLGAAVLHSGVSYLEYAQAISGYSQADINDMLSNGRALLESGKNYSDPNLAKANIAANVPAVGASGAVFGVLTAFGLLFPNTLLYIYGVLPVKAKYLIILYIAVEVYSGFINAPGDNVAHFAHLGGALFGFIMVKIWGADKKRFY
ncbi:MAG: rhomboid family intramembrane serine protease [Chitinophagales bacterium]|nr:rhomboid family intramembrane serine protease [Chitinophagales bacterium]